MTDKLTKLQSAKKQIKEHRNNRVCQIKKAGWVSHFEGAEGYLVSAINELWDLVCDIANRRVDEEIIKEAQRMAHEAEKVLKDV